MALVRVYCGLASADGGERAPGTESRSRPLGPVPSLTAALVDDAGRLLELCEFDDDPTGYSLLNQLLAERATGPYSVAIAADREDRPVATLLAVGGWALTFADDDAADDFTERYTDDLADEIASVPHHRRAVALARALHAGTLSAGLLPTPPGLAPVKPLLAAHGALATGRQAAATALREVLRELYPAALRAYADPCDPLSLAVIDAFPEPGKLGSPSSGHGAGRGGRGDAAAAADAITVQLAETGVGDQSTIAEAITALRVAIAENPRRSALGRSATAPVAEAVRHCVAAVRAYDRACAALAESLADRMTGHVPAQRDRAGADPAPASAQPTPTLAAAALVAPTPTASAPPAPAPSGAPAPPLPARRRAAAHARPASAPPTLPVSASPTRPAAASAAARATPAPSDGQGRRSRASGAPSDLAGDATRPARRADPRPPAPEPVSPPPVAPLPVAPPPAPPEPVSAPAATLPRRSAPVPSHGRPVSSPAGSVASAPPIYGRPVSSPAGSVPPPPPAHGRPISAPPPPPPGIAPIAEPRPPRQARRAPEPAAHTRNGTDHLPKLPAPRSAPEGPSLGSRSDWPTSPPPDDWATDPMGATNGGVSGATNGRGASDPLANASNGRVTPPWLADDLQPPEPPGLRLVEPKLPEELRGELGYANGWQEPPPLRLVEPSPPTGLPQSAPPVAATADDDDLLIFAQTRSAWFTGHGEDVSWTSTMDAGWQAAEQAAQPAVGDRTGAGLPRRVPHANLVPGAPPRAPERPLRIVRDPNAIAKHTSGYFSGWRRGQQIGGFPLGGRPGRQSAGAWDFSRDEDRDYGT